MTRRKLTPIRHQLRDCINRIMKQRKGCTLSELARASGVSDWAMRRAARGDNISTNAVDALVKGLGIRCTVSSPAGKRKRKGR